MRKAVAFLKRAEAVEQRIDALLSQIELYKSLTQRVTASWGSEFTAHARNVGANENAIIRLTEARRELEKLTQEYRDAVEEITAVVNSMDNQAHRIILLNYYLSHMNFEKIAERIGLSRSRVYHLHTQALDELEMLLQVQRFIRLNNLEPPLIDKVDAGKLAFTPAVELSYLKPEEQQWLDTALENTQQTPSLSQAQRMKRESKQGTLSEQGIMEIMTENKQTVPAKGSVVLPQEKLTKYFPRSYTTEQMEKVIFKLLDYWVRKRQMSQER